MKTADFLHKYDACEDGAEWALSISDDMADVWEAMIKERQHEWLIWTATRPGVFTDAVLRKLACRFVRETPLADGRTAWDLLADERSRMAIEVAEAYVDGNATADELADARQAADAACVADCATRAARVAAAYAADAATYAPARAVSAAAAGTAEVAYEVAYAAAPATAHVGSRAAAIQATRTAFAAQIHMVAELGNPFKKGASK